MRRNVRASSAMIYLSKITAKGDKKRKVNMHPNMTTRRGLIPVARKRAKKTPKNPYTTWVPTMPSTKRSSSTQAAAPRFIIFPTTKIKSGGKKASYHLTHPSTLCPYMAYLNPELAILWCEDSDGYLGVTVLLPFSLHVW